MGVFNVDYDWIYENSFDYLNLQLKLMYGLKTITKYKYSFNYKCRD